MRINRLNLIAIGPFTGAQLDLSPGEQGLHLVYGLNEAGKSTSLRAMTYLLYGFPKSVSDDFRHNYGQLRIGGQLQSRAGAVLDVVRRKASKNSLRCGEDRNSIDDGELSRFLGDVDRELFELMFGINHERLVAGGQSIAKGSGRIGQMLFAASTGISDLHRVQSELQSEADALLKSTGRSGSIHDAIKQFQERRRSVVEAQVTHETWKKHDSALRQAKDRREDLVERMRKLQTEQNRLQRIANAIPIVVSWREKKDESADLVDVPALPDGFLEECQSLLTDFTATQRQCTDAQNELAKCSEQLDAAMVPVNLLAESDHIEALRDRVGRYRESIADLPKLESEYEVAERDAIEILKQLGRVLELSAVEELRLPSNRIVRIQELGTRHEGLLEKLKSAQREAKKRKREVESTEKQLAELPTVVSSASVKAVLEDVRRRGGLESERADLEQELNTIESEASSELAGMKLWIGDLDRVCDLPIPASKTIDRFREAFVELKQRLKTAKKDLQESQKKCERLSADLLRLERDQSVPTQLQLIESRESRDNAWQKLIADWQSNQPPDPAKVDAYARLVLAADRFADDLRTDADRVAQKSSLQLDRDRELAESQKSQADFASVQTDSDRLEQEWIDIWKPLGITPLSPAEMQEWTSEHARLADKVKRIKVLRRKTVAAQSEIEAFGRQLIDALATLGETNALGSMSLAALVDRLSASCDEIQKTGNRREQLQDSLEKMSREQEEIQSRLKESESEVDRWRDDWAVEMERLGLEHNALPSQANSVLTGTMDLFRKSELADNRRRRIKHIKRDTKAFEDDVRALTQRVAPDLVETAAAQAITTLSAQLQSARDAEQTKKALQRQRDDAEQKIANATSRLAELKSLLDLRCRQARCERQDQLMEGAIRSKRRLDLEKSVEELHEQLIRQSGGAEVLAFVEEVEKEAADSDALSPRMEELGDAIQRLDLRREDVIKEIEREESELRLIDDSGLAAERELECAGLEARLESEVQQLAVLRAASAILAEGIERHRKKNQGPVLERASEMFSRFTQVSFAGLRADFDDRGEPVLVGVRSGDGEIVPISGMSDGTCDQVYLALRLASLEAWMEHHEPMPLIVDDVLLNFDNPRSVATLEVLAELSRKTQVIFFTHHRHLVDIAQDNLQSDDLFVTEISGSACAPV